uniref:Uncharacterized protein n=1 Tax=Lotharella globosa TaxID=91324 RepID=A0A6V3RSE2_9EUKA|mmetsp:Transcript_1765/g.3400  ORF Transcript_1765/g.3400 Transcript_1765/m.3400 type:complete len:126 (+) Transcript_1765:102-479(+)
MANDVTLMTSVAGCIISLLVAQHMALRLSVFAVLMTSIGYHGFSRRKGGLVHKIDIATVAVCVAVHVSHCPDYYFATLASHYGGTIFMFGCAHNIGEKAWYLTSVAHACGAFSNFALSNAMAEVL